VDHFFSAAITWGFDYFYDNRHQLLGAAEATTSYQGDWQHTDAGRLTYASIVAPGAPFATEREVSYDYSGASDPEAVDALVRIDQSLFATYNFKANPTPRPGTEGLSKEIQQQSIDGRIRHLEKEIGTFRNNIEKLRGGGQ
jgi:hypothetical protein